MQVLVLRRLRSLIKGQLFIAGVAPFEGAKVTVQIVEPAVPGGNETDTVFVENTYDLGQRPANNWMPFDLPIDWQAVRGREEEVKGGRTFDLAEMVISATIVSADGKPLYVTKNRHPMDLARSDSWMEACAVVVVEPV